MCWYSLSYETDDLSFQVDERYQLWTYIIDIIEVYFLCRYSYQAPSRNY